MPARVESFKLSEKSALTKAAADNSGINFNSDAVDDSAEEAEITNKEDKGCPGPVKVVQNEDDGTKNFVIEARAVQPRF